MTEIFIVQHLSDGFTVKEVAAKLLVSPRLIENKIVKMKDIYFAKTQSHLVAIFIRRQLVS